MAISAFARNTLSSLLILGILFPAADASATIISGTFSGIVLSQAEGSSVDKFNQFGEGNGADLGGQAMSGTFRIDTSLLELKFVPYWTIYGNTAAAGAVTMTTTINNHTMTTTSTASASPSSWSGSVGFTTYGAGLIEVDISAWQEFFGLDSTNIDLVFSVGPSAGIDPGNVESINGRNLIPIAGSGNVTIGTEPPDAGTPGAVIYATALDINTTIGPPDLSGDGGGGGPSVPEPASMAMLGSSLALLAATRRKRG